MKRYYGTDRPGTQVRVSTGYDLGGMNYFSGETSRRGYYVFVQPVQQISSEGIQMETMTLFEGFKQLLLEVTRQSAKSAAEAEALAEGMADRLAQRLADEKGFALVGGYEGR